MCCLPIPYKESPFTDKKSNRFQKPIDPGTLNKMYTRTGYLFLMEKKALGSSWNKYYCHYQKVGRAPFPDFSEISIFTFFLSRPGIRSVLHDPLQPDDAEDRFERDVQIEGVHQARLRLDR